LIIKKTFYSPLLYPAFQDGGITRIIATVAPDEFPGTRMPFGRLGQPVVWIIVLPNPLFNVGALAAVVSIAGVAL
jgi:hypothetical protein